MPANEFRAATPAELSEAEIAQRAYERWIARGCPAGDGREDWFAAEAELQAERLDEPALAPKAKQGRIRSALRRLAG